MAKRLWIIRHGDAEPHGVVDDASRKLTLTGEEEGRAAGLALKALGESPAEILTSPRVRAQQTAELAGEPFGLVPVVHEPLSIGFGGSDALDVLATRTGGGTIVLVGHMPDLSNTIADRTGAQVALRTGGMALLRGDGARLELAVLLRPRETRALADGP